MERGREGDEQFVKAKNYRTKRVNEVIIKSQQQQQQHPEEGEKAIFKRMEISVRHSIFLSITSQQHIFLGSL